MNKSIFITATDTGVGKTTVSAGLVSILKEENKNVGYFKPIETGCNPIPEDAKLLSQITGQPIEEAVLYTFKPPVAPYVAEKLEKKSIAVDNIISRFNLLRKKYDYLIVEGAGGVCVPITRIDGKFYTYVDLIKDFDIPVLIVSRGTLGTINHTCMTVKILKEEGINISGIILNLLEINSNDISQTTNPSVIMEMTDVPVLAKCNLNIENPIKECEGNLEKIVRKIFS